MKQPRKQVYFSKSSIDKDLLEFIEMQSNLSKSITLGMQVLFEVFGKIDLKDYIPVGFEAHDTPVTYEKLMKLAEEANTTASNNLAHINELDPSVNKSELVSGMREEQNANTDQLLSPESILANLNPEAIQALQLLFNPVANNTQAPVETNAKPLETKTPVVNESPNPIVSTVSSNEDKNVEGVGVNPVSSTHHETDSSNEDKTETSTNSEGQAGAWSGIEDFDI